MILFAIVIYIVWKGTHIQKFFSKCNFVLIQGFCIFYFVSNMLIVLYDPSLLEDDDGIEDHSGLFLKLLSVVNVFYLQISWIYYGRSRKYRFQDGIVDTSQPV